MSHLDKDVTSTVSAVEGLRSLQRIGVLTVVAGSCCRRIEARCESVGTVNQHCCSGHLTKQSCDYGSNFLTKSQNDVPITEAHFSFLFFKG